jgi:predicted nucleotidyltransferase
MSGSPSPPRRKASPPGEREPGVILARCYTAGVIERLRSELEADPRVAYAILFGSRGRGSAHARSDTDVAIGLTRGASLSAAEVGDLLSRLEAAAGGPVDLVLLDEAGPALAYRVFRDGRVILEKDRRALVQRKARAILEYLDFRPVEETLTRAVLGAGPHG